MPYLNFLRSETWFALNPSCNVEHKAVTEHKAVMYSIYVLPYLHINDLRWNTHLKSHGARLLQTHCHGQKRADVIVLPYCGYSGPAIWVQYQSILVADVAGDFVVSLWAIFHLLSFIIQAVLWPISDLLWYLNCYMWWLFIFGKHPPLQAVQKN